MGVSRRGVLKGGALGAIGLAAVGVPTGAALRAKAASRLAASKLPRPFTRSFARPPVLGSTGSQLVDGVPHDVYSVVARPGQTWISPAVPTRIWAYEGIFPGPTIVAERGRPSLVKVHNQLPPTHPQFGYELLTSTHLHGSASKPQYDGYANDLTPRGYCKGYRYPNAQNARSIWYHDHKIHHTALNVYTGLAAAYLIKDDVERALLPQGEFDVPLVVNDCILDTDGSLVYADNSHSGLWGDVVLVNGVPWPTMQVQPRLYRFRVLNASIGRSYRFRLSDGAPVWVVATDGGLVPKAQQVTSWRHGQAERYEVLVDFSRYSPGTRVRLQNLSNPNNVDYPNTGQVMQFEVLPGPADPTNNTRPSTLFPEHEAMALKASDATRTRRFRLERKDGFWKINGETWDEVVASGFTHVQADPGLGDVEIWEIENRSGGWFHPTHLHLVDFQVLSRNGGPPYAWERGPKDVVYVGENETVRLLIRFGPHEGRYMMHCHNLPHEDHDMMTQFRVGPPRANDPNDPIAADPCYLDDEF